MTFSAGLWEAFMSDEKDTQKLQAADDPAETLPSLSDVLTEAETAVENGEDANEIIETSEEYNELSDAEDKEPESVPTEPIVYEDAPQDNQLFLHINEPAVAEVSDKQRNSNALQIAGVVISSLTLCAAAAGLFVALNRVSAVESELEQRNEHIESLKAEKIALEADYVEAMNIIDEPPEPEKTEGIEAEDGKLLIYEGSVGYAWVPILSGVEQNTYKKSNFSVDERGRMKYTDENGQDSSYFGIDVSSYQGDIDWQPVREDGVEFAFIRAGYRGYGEEGKLCADEKFAANYDGAHSAGIDTGVYFFSQAITPEEAVEEANFVLEILDGRPLEYPVVFDWENVSVSSDEEAPRTEDVMPQTLTLSAIAFCETIEDAGYKSMIYTNKKQAVLKYDLRQLKKYPIWFAYYDTTLNYCYDFDVWQYGTAFVDGIEGEVDVNIAMID